METPINPKFMALAYALILLRKEGYPCVFYGDLYGLCEPHSSPPTCWGKLPDLVLARKLFAYGIQTDYFEKNDCIGWIRSGVSEDGKNSGLAIVMSWQQDKTTMRAKSDAMDRIRKAFKKSDRSVSPVTDPINSEDTRVQQRQPHSPRVRMKVGREKANQTWRDLLGWEWADVPIDSEGFGVFPCQSNSLAVFTAADAKGRNRFPVQFDHDIYQKGLE